MIGKTGQGDRQKMVSVVWIFFLLFLTVSAKISQGAMRKLESARQPTESFF